MQNFTRKHGAFNGLFEVESANNKIEIQSLEIYQFKYLLYKQIVVLKEHQTTELVLNTYHIPRFWSVVYKLVFSPFSKGADMALMLRLCGNQSLCTHLARNFIKEFSKNIEEITQFKSKMFSIDFHTNSIHPMFLLLETTDKFRDCLKGEDMALTLRLCGNQTSLYTFGQEFYQGIIQKHRKLKLFKTETFSFDFHTNSIHTMFLPF